MQEKIIMDHLTNIFLVIVVGVYSFVRGKAIKASLNPKRLLSCKMQNSGIWSAQHLFLER